MAQSAYNTFNLRSTPQSQSVPDKNMVENKAGGYAFQADDWTRLKRFLVLGTSAGTFYTSPKDLTKENAEVVIRCIKEDGTKTVSEIVRVSGLGLAPSNDPALFALAIAASLGDGVTRKYALDRLSAVARIPTHLFHFVAYTQQFRGWGRGLRTAVAKWYTNQHIGDLAYQVTKYQSRDGWSNADLIRLTHPKPFSQEQNVVLKWAMGKELSDEEYASSRSLEGFYRVQHAENSKVAASLISEYGLPREVVPTQFLNDPEVWDALLERMPLTAMIRNLGKMTSVGLLAGNMSEGSSFIASKLVYADGIRKSRVHPMQLLIAQRVYQQGHGEKGSLKWNPVQKIVDALDDAFYLALDNVEPTGKRLLLAVDESGSMTKHVANPNTPLSAYEAAVAMAFVFARTEPNYELVGFDTSVHEATISPRQRLSDALNRRPHGGGTDVSSPFIYAAQKGLSLDGVVLFTDDESWAGGEHVFQTVARLRRVEKYANLKVVHSMFAANATTLRDPSDALSMEVVGFSTDVPTVVSGFLSDKF